MKTCIEIIEADIGRPLVDGWGDEVTRQERAVFDAHVAPIPHIHTVTDAVAAAGLPSCVASSSVMGHIETVLRHIGLTAHFSGNLYSATMVAHGKPAPDLFLHAAREMGHGPERCVVIEDSLPGVQAGVAAGMKVYGYAGDPETDAGTLAEAGAHVFDDMRKLGPLMGL
jgi:HAD superfamily hydrolase (TIGR01509 family)